MSGSHQKNTVTQQVGNGEEFIRLNIDIGVGVNIFYFHSVLLLVETRQAIQLRRLMPLTVGDKTAEIS